jgi:hypothetical protein
VANIFDDEPAAQAQQPASVQTTNPPAAQAQQPASVQTTTPAKRSFKLSLNKLVGFAGFFLLALGVFGMALPTDPWLRSFGKWVAVDVCGNSLTNLGYLVILVMLAAALVGGSLGRLGKGK